jgi:hypothetical protein
MNRANVLTLPLDPHSVGNLLPSRREDTTAQGRVIQLGMRFGCGQLTTSGRE